jgi:shikimate dehydrogenase
MSGAPEQPIDGATRFCALLGHPVQHSASPAMQNAGFAALGVNWRYLALDVHPDDLRAAIAGAKAMKFVGLNLTVPHKVLAMDMLDALDESARTWGAVNTVRFEARASAGQWQPLHRVSVSDTGEIRAQGFNTDADALARSLQEDLGIELAGAKVLVLGLGGAGQVAALRLAIEKPAEVFLVDSVNAKAEAVAQQIRQRHPRVKAAVGFPKGTVDLLLHATPLGWKASDPSPLADAPFLLAQARAVYDMVYRPAETPLLAVAKAAGCRTANGLGMLLYQGARALELWSGLSAPIEIMRRAEHLREMTNDRIRMTQEFPVTNSKERPGLVESQLSFELRHSLVIRLPSLVIGPSISLKMSRRIAYGR